MVVGDAFSRIIWDSFSKSVEIRIIPISIHFYAFFCDQEQSNKDFWYFSHQSVPKDCSSALPLLTCTRFASAIPDHRDAGILGQVIAAYGLGNGIITLPQLLRTCLVPAPTGSQIMGWGAIFKTSNADQSQAACNALAPRARSPRPRWILQRFRRAYLHAFRPLGGRNGIPNAAPSESIEFEQ